MGGSSSKVAQGAAGAAKRKLPTTVSSTMHQRSPVPPTSTPPPSSTQQTQQSSPGQQSMPTPGPTVYPSSDSPGAQPSENRNQFIDLDARDPTFSSRLQSIGPVQPAPTASNTSTFNPKPTTFQSESSPSPLSSSGSTGMIFPSAKNNPALLVIQARERNAQKAQEENEAMGRKGFQGRTVVDAATLGLIVRARDAGKSDEDVEGRWRLRKGILQETLGPAGKVFAGVT